MTKKTDHKWQTSLTSDARTTSPDIVFSRRSVLKTMAISAGAGMALEMSACAANAQSDDLTSAEQAKVTAPPLQWPAGATGHRKQVDQATKDGSTENHEENRICFT